MDLDEKIRDIIKNEIKYNLTVKVDWNYNNSYDERKELIVGIYYDDELVDESKLLVVEIME